MAVLVIAEHDNKTLKRATLQAVDAATRLGEVHLLVLGSGVDAVAQAAAKVAGVVQVKVVDDPALAEPLAEVVTAQVVPLAKDYSHVVAAATAHGKDFMPRVAALLDVAQTDLRGDRHRFGRHLPPAHLRRQRHCHRAEQRPHQGADGARHVLRRGRR